METEAGREEATAPAKGALATYRAACEETVAVGSSEIPVWTGAFAAVGIVNVNSPASTITKAATTGKNGCAHHAVARRKLRDPGEGGAAAEGSSKVGLLGDRDRPDTEPACPVRGSCIRGIGTVTCAINLWRAK